jgi:tryptophan-rich sensory protein
VVLRAGLGLVGWVLATYTAAITGAVSARSAARFYATLRKPTWAPPSWAFGPAWSVLYTLMAIAAWTIWRDYGFDRSGGALTLYFVQLTANAIWSWLFFVKRTGVWAFVDAVILWSTILATLVAFWQLHPSAGILFLPYLAWVSLATALTWSVWRRNPDLL